MQICLLTTTRNRNAEFHRLLGSLRQQSHQEFSLLLGDQNPPEMLADTLAEYGRHFPITRVQLPPLSLSDARNALLPHVPDDAHTIVALTDDDCWYAPDALEQVATAFAEDATLVALVGNGNGNSKAKSGPVGQYGMFANCPSWVLFFRASVMHEIGQFDASMGIGATTPWQSGEETDYLLRVWQAHPQGVQRRADVVVFHPETLAPPAKVRGYAAGRMYLLAKHGLPWWFTLANILFPLLALPRDARRHGATGLRYRWGMFCGRLGAWWQLKTNRLH